MSSKILLTGATGFTGARLAKHLLENTDWEIFSLERISVRPNQLGDLASSPRIHRIYHDFRAELPERILKQLEGVDYIVHNGAEVHGLRSLENPELFVHTNVMGTFNMLEAARHIKPKAFLYVSSAEAVGAAPTGSLKENCTLKPSNPYAAAKAAGEMLARTYYRSFDVPAMTVRTMNIFGEQQDTSKFLPATIKKVLNGETVTCHVDANGKSGSRHWIYVGELVKAMHTLLCCGWPGEVYHVVGPEIDNLEVIRTVASTLLVKMCDLQFQQPGPSHDMRYSIQDTKLNGDFYNTIDTLKDMRSTVKWYQENPQWLEF
jgi:dTDP-glucose 4,6-dehydratase